MRNYYLCFWVIVSLLSLSSCSKDNATEENIRKEVKVTATFKGLSASNKVTTRVTGNSWDNGDAIGLFMKKAGVDLGLNTLANNVKYTYDGTSQFLNHASKKVYFPFKKENVDFVSYYPYTADIIDYTYEVDVSNQDNLTALDLMYANNVNGVNSTNQTINLEFNHQLTKVVLNLLDNLSEEELATFNAKISNVNTKASFLLSDGSLTDKREIADVPFYIDSENKKAEAILLPENDLINNELIIQIGGISYSYPLKNSATIKSFKSSAKCEYNITLESNEDRVLQGVTAEITDWTTVTEDITATETFPSDEEGDSGEIESGAGDGTKDNPYTIAQVIKMLDQEDITDEKGKMFFNDVWVEGYIVGNYDQSNNLIHHESHFKTGNIFTLALADLHTEESSDNAFPVSFYQDDNGSTSFYSMLNLHYNPENKGKLVLLNADIGNWIIERHYPIPAIVKLKKVVFKDKE